NEPAKSAKCSQPRPTRSSYLRAGINEPLRHRHKAFQEAFELLAADGVLQLADGFGFDLADTLASHLEDAADLFQRVGVTVPQAVAQFDDFSLAVRQRLEDDVNLLLEHLGGGRVDRVVGASILDEVAEITVFAFADRPIQADRMPRDFQDSAGFLETDAGEIGGFLNGRLAAVLLEQLFVHTPQPGHRFDHVYRNADRASLIGDRSCERF